MNLEQINEVLSASFHVATDIYGYDQEVRDNATEIHDRMVKNLLVLANGDADQRSTETMHVFAVWTPLSGPFLDLFKSTEGRSSLGYETSALSMHS